MMLDTEKDEQGWHSQVSKIWHIHLTLLHEGYSGMEEGAELGTDYLTDIPSSHPLRFLRKI